MSAMARLAFWRHIPRFSARVRMGLAALVVVLAAGDAVWVPRLLPKPDEVELVVSFPEATDQFYMGTYEGFHLSHPAQLSLSENSWIIDGHEEGDLTAYINAKASDGDVRARLFVKNVTVTLGPDATYQRALAAFTKLAREGTCFGAIPDNGTKWLPTLWKIESFRNAEGKALSCTPSDSFGIGIAHWGGYAWRPLDPSPTPPPPLPAQR